MPVPFSAPRWTPRIRARAALFSTVARLAILLCAGCDEVAQVLAFDPDFDAGAAHPGDSGQANGDAMSISDSAARDVSTSRRPDSGIATIMVDAGTDHTCAVIEGALYCWGANQRGRLGVGDIDNRSLPARVGSDFDWVEVAAGDDHTCARRADGSVWCFGANDHGQLGSPGVNDVLSPLRVELARPAISISTERNFACALLDDRTLYCWGENDEGQLGLDDTYPGADQFSPVRVGMFGDWIAIDTGQGHACGLRAPGALFCWGRNTDSQLGLGPGAPAQIRTPTQVGDATDWTEASAGQNHSCAIHANGELDCFGGNDFANLGTGDRAPRDVPTPIGSESYHDVSLDTFHTCAISSAGSLSCWGRNLEGQLGMGDNDDRLVPAAVPDGTFRSISVGRFHTCGVKTDGSIECTGANDAGQLGLGDTDRRNVFTRVPDPQD